MSERARQAYAQDLEPDVSTSVKKTDIRKKEDVKECTIYPSTPKSSNTPCQQLHIELRIFESNRPPNWDRRGCIGAFSGRSLADSLSWEETDTRLASAILFSANCFLISSWRRWANAEGGA